MTVAELFERVLPRLKHMPPAMDFVHAAHAVQDVITRRLWEARSDLLKDHWESDEVAIGDSLVDLPSDMLGAGDDLPYITYLGTDGSTAQVATLRPLSHSRSDYVSAEDAIPLEYEIRGSTLEVFPTTSVAFNLYLTMYRRPAALTAMEDELPWNGFYDQLFQDAVLYLASPTGSFAYVSPAIEAALRRAVDTGSSLRTGRRVQWLWA